MLRDHSVGMNQLQRKALHDVDIALAALNATLSFADSKGLQITVLLDKTSGAYTRAVGQSHPRAVANDLR